MKKYLLTLFLLFMLCPAVTHAYSEQMQEPIHMTLDIEHITDPVSIDPGTGISYAQSPSLHSSQVSVSRKQVNRIYKAMNSYKKSVNLNGYHLTPSAFMTACNKAFNQNYYLLDSILDMNFTIYRDRRTGYVSKAYFHYSLSRNTMQKRRTALTNAVRSAMRYIGPKKSSEQIAVAAHDYIIKRASYDIPYSVAASKNPAKIDKNKHSAKGILADRSGVCAGYAYAYRILLSEYDVPCTFVESTAMNHAWNLVKLGKDWYHVDTTWDDPDANPAWGKKGSGSMVYYDFFLLNDSEMLKKNHHSWDSRHTASSSLYSGMPRGTSMSQQFYNGNWYYFPLSANDVCTYYQTDMKGKNTRTIREATSFYSFYKDRAYYVSDHTKLQSMNLDGQETRDLTHLTGLPENTIYLTDHLSGRTLYFYYLAPDPEETDDDIYDDSFWKEGYITLSDYDMRTSDAPTILKISDSSKTLKRHKSFRLRAAAGPHWASGRQVYFKSSKKKVASVGKTSGIIKARRKGTAVITAYVPGTALKKTCKVRVK